MEGAFDSNSELYNQITNGYILDEGPLSKTIYATITAIVSSGATYGVNTAITTFGAMAATRIITIVGTAIGSIALGIGFMWTRKSAAE